MSRPKLETLTVTDLMRIFSLSRQRIRKALTKLQPKSVRGDVPRYDAAKAIQAVAKSDETPQERTERARCDLLEHQNRRISAQSLDREAVETVWMEKLRRLVSVVKTTKLPLRDRDRERLVTQLENEIQRIPQDVEHCMFPEGDESIEEPDTNHS